MSDAPMEEIQKKRKRKRNYSSGSENDEDETLVNSMEEVVKLEENVDEGKEEDANVESAFKVIGQTSFVENTKIKVQAKWIREGCTFPAELSEENLAKLKTVPGLDPVLFKCVKSNVKRWFPVQKAVLPHLIAESNRVLLLPPRDIAISAPTGSGKTLCYILPIINALKGRSLPGSLYALILAPVQNLVHQIYNEFKKFDPFNTKTVLLCGGHDFGVERTELLNAAVAFATPARLVEHLMDPSCSLSIAHLRYLVVDEADRMNKNVRLEWLNYVERAANLTAGFTALDDLLKVNHTQKILVSATLSCDVEKLHEWRLRYPRLFRANAREAKAVEPRELASADDDHIEGAIMLPTSLRNHFIVSETNFKPLAAFTQISKNNEWKRVLIFVNNKVSSRRLSLLLGLLGKDSYAVCELSSNLFGRRRQKILSRFARGDVRVLVSSDVMSRGMDVHGIDAVINYDLPADERLYVHRVGRTARCGAPGVALNLVTQQEKSKLEEMLRRVNCWDGMTKCDFEERQDSELQDRYRVALASLKDILEKHPTQVENGTKKGNGKARFRSDRGKRRKFVSHM